MVSRWRHCKRANPVKLAEVPAFAPNSAETKPYSLEEIVAMLKVLSEPSATAVATAAFTGLRLGELRGLTWESYDPARDDESLGWLNVTRSVWRSTIGDPKTAKSKAPVPVIPQLAQRLDAHRKKCGNPVAGPIFANSVGHPLDLNACYQREMKDILKRAGICWHGWHGFRRGLASNLNRLGVDDSVIQRILRHSTVATTQNHYIKTASPDAIAAMRQFLIVLHVCSK
jgi:integrase